jgi:hypothetical protein
MILDWSSFKKPEEEKKLDFSAFKPPEEKTLDWSSLKPPTTSVGLGRNANATAGISLPETEISLPENKLGVLGVNKETTIKQYNPPKENWWDKVKGIFKAKPEDQIAKAQVSYNISQKTGIPITEVNQNLDKITKDMKIRGIPTTEEMISVAMILNPLTAGLIGTHPISLVTGAAKYMGMGEIVNAIVSKAKGIKYKFGAGKSIKDLLPEDTNQMTKDAIDIAEMFGKGAIIAATDKNVMKLWDQFTKQTTTEYNLPEKMYLSADKIKDIYRKGGIPESEYPQFEADILSKVQGNKANIVRTALKNGGVDIEIPATEMVTFADKPWFAKVKEAFGIKPISNTVISYGKGVIKPSVGGLLEGKVGIPETPVVTPPIKPVTPAQVKTSIPKELAELAEEDVNKIAVVESLLPKDTIMGPQARAKFTGEIANKGLTIIDKLPVKLTEAKKIDDVGGDGQVGIYGSRFIESKISKGKLTVYHGTSSKVAEMFYGNVWSKLNDGSYLSLTKSNTKEAIGIYGAGFYKDLAKKYGIDAEVVKFEIPIEHIGVDRVTGELRFINPNTNKTKDFYTQATAGVKAVGKGEATIPVTEKPAGVDKVGNRVQEWIDLGNSKPVAESLAKIEEAGLLDNVEGHSGKGGVVPFSVRVKNKITGEINYITSPTRLHQFAKDITTEEAGKSTLTPIAGTGETKTRGLAVSVESKAIADKLTEGFGDLPQYKVINAQDQADKTAKIINSDYELAKKMALGEVGVPTDILPESMFTAVRVKAEKEGDIDTIIKLATSPVRTVEATVMGQRIQALGVKDPESPVFAIQDLDATLTKANESKLKGANKLFIPEIDKNIQNAEVEGYSKKQFSNKQTWTDFINEIRCK